MLETCEQSSTSPQPEPAGGTDKEKRPMSALEDGTYSVESQNKRAAFTPFSAAHRLHFLQFHDLVIAEIIDSLVSLRPEVAAPQNSLMFFIALLPTAKAF